MPFRVEAAVVLPLIFSVAAAQFFNFPYFNRESWLRYEGVQPRYGDSSYAGKTVQTNSGITGLNFIGSAASSNFGGSTNGGPVIVSPPVPQKPWSEDESKDDDEQIDLQYYRGEWEMACENSGISAMHMQLMITNKVVMFDATNFGPSRIPLPPGNCRIIEDGDQKMDCWAHAVEYDLETGHLRPLKLFTNSWCSSGGLDVEGNLVQSGGWNDGGKGVRYLNACSTCDWVEYPNALSAQRWYATQITLADGQMVVIGGRRQFTYEFVPVASQTNTANFKLPLLKETSDEVENNLYPFVYLNTDGNLFIFSNNRSILFDYKTNTVVREYPVLPGGSRNYPSSAMSVLLPLKLRGNSIKTLAEVLICGGAPRGSAERASKAIFVPALRSCARLPINRENATWRIEVMPTERVMGDMLLLPTADVLLLNGAKKGCAGWGFAEEPNRQPLLYQPSKPRPERFIRLKSSSIPRMYHSTSAVLPDGKILVAGSNTNNGYNFTGVRFPTELRVEKFMPPYLDPQRLHLRPVIITDGFSPEIQYGVEFVVSVEFTPGVSFGENGAMVTMYLPPFTTHGYSMNQRMLVLRIRDVQPTSALVYDVRCVAPEKPQLAPPGYYLLSVVNLGVPSTSVWIRIR